MKFIYVMSEVDKEKMLALGYKYIKSDERNGVHIFSNKSTATFADSNELEDAGIRHVNSDVIAF